MIHSHWILPRRSSDTPPFSQSPGLWFYCSTFSYRIWNKSSSKPFFFFFGFSCTWVTEKQGLEWGYFHLSVKMSYLLYPFDQMTCIKHPLTPVSLPFNLYPAVDPHIIHLDEEFHTFCMFFNRNSRSITSPSQPVFLKNRVAIHVGISDRQAIP